MCCRTPAYGIRANTLKGLTASTLAEEIRELGGTAVPSRLLPREFCRVEAGLQQVLASGMSDRGLCMVRVPDLPQKLV